MSLISGAFITNCPIKCAIKTGTNKTVKNDPRGISRQGREGIRLEPVPLRGDSDGKQGYKG